jgi:hypothetical protein
VLEQIRALARHPGQWHDCLQQAQPLVSDRLVELAAEKATLDKELAEWKKEMRHLAKHVASGKNGDATAISRLAELQEQVLSGERRATELAEEMVALRRHQVTSEELARAADLLDGRWESRSRSDQARLLRHLLQRLDCEGGRITVSFNAAGIKILAEELMHQESNP